MRTAETFLGATAAFCDPLAMTEPRLPSRIAVAFNWHNWAGLLETTSVNVRQAATATRLITNIDYNARGQRVTLARGEQAAAGDSRTVMTYVYDDRSLRAVARAELLHHGHVRLLHKHHKLGRKQPILILNPDPAFGVNGHSNGTAQKSQPKPSPETENACRRIGQERRQGNQIPFIGPLFIAVHEKLHWAPSGRHGGDPQTFAVMLELDVEVAHRRCPAGWHRLANQQLREQGSAGAELSTGPKILQVLRDLAGAIIIIPTKLLEGGAYGAGGSA
jgi:hypothetical protein